jgi:Ca-activated chloride channel family protein
LELSGTIVRFELGKRVANVMINKNSRYKIYTRWFKELENTQSNYEQLFKLFHNILLRTNGDVNEALHWMTTLNNRYNFTDDIGGFIDQLKEQGLISENDNIYILTNKGNQTIRKSSFNEVFSQLRKKDFGNHSTPYEGRGFEKLPETRPYTFGDSIDHLEPTRSISNAIRRNGIENFNLTEDDLEVFETEHMTTCATVLLIDISHSMVLYGEDRITPAKNVALALTEFIMQEYDKDSIHVVAFGDDAQEIKVTDLPYLSVGPYHTNTKAALQLARQILNKKKHENKQIFMITDGKPSCIWEGLKLYKNPFGLDRKIVNQTLKEAVLCRKHKIDITTFMVARDPYLQGFVKELAETSRGRAYFTGLKNLGEYVFVDFIRNRRKTIR